MSSNSEHWIVDAGNTRTKLVVFDGDSLVGVTSDDDAERHAIQSANDDQLPAHALVAASGELNAFWSDWCTQNRQDKSGKQRVFHLENAATLALETAYESIETLGLDRAANARAVTAEDADSNWLIIDAGTCITADWIESGEFMGGSIAPGIDLRLRSMYAGTANLPYPENWRELATEGVGLHLGLNTIEALLAGAIGGANAELQERVEAFHNEFGTFRVALTGGDAECLELRTPCPIFADPNLTWKGFHLILNDLVQKH